MKEKTRKTIIIIICLLVIIIAIHILGYLFRPLDSDNSTQSIEAFHEMPKNSIEVMGYGSSHMWKTLNPLEMYEKYGIGSFNYGCNYQAINTTLLFLEESLMSQRPKVVLIETYKVDTILKDENVNGEIYYTREVKNFEGKRKYLKQVFGNDVEKYISYYIPLYMFHENWINIKNRSFHATDNKGKYKKYMGYYYTKEIQDIKLGAYTKDKQKKLDEDSIEILDSIIDLSKKYDFKVIFFTVPYHSSNGFLYSDAMEEYAKNNNAVYIDFFKLINEINIDEKKDYSDNGHTNINGANKISDYLGKYIIDNYEVSDYRKIKDNLWEKQLKK